MSTERDKAILNSIFNPLMPVGEDVYSEELASQLEDFDEDGPEANHVKELELQGVKEAEKGNVVRALEYLNQAISFAPRKASLYNNRAQALRLVSKTEEAMDDLNAAIDLSGGIGRTACQALTQRGLIFRLWEKDEEAQKDFTAAAGQGSHFAKSQLVQMNPYAALCNKMLHGVFQKLQKGECVDE